MPVLFQDLVKEGLCKIFIITDIIVLKKQWQIQMFKSESGSAHLEPKQIKRFFSVLFSASVCAMNKEGL